MSVKQDVFKCVHLNLLTEGMKDSQTGQDMREVRATPLEQRSLGTHRRSSGSGHRA